MMKYWLALVMALMLNATANLMLKVGSRRFDVRASQEPQGLGGLITSVASNWIWILGLICFAVNVVFYSYALSSKDMKVSAAYPIMFGGGFAIIAVVAWRLLGESLTTLQWVGIATILLGVWLVARDLAVAPGT